MKHMEVVVSDNSTRAKCIKTDNNDRLVVLEPSLSGSIPSQATFKILSSRIVSVDVCLPRRQPLMATNLLVTFTDI